MRSFFLLPSKRRGVFFFQQTKEEEKKKRGKTPLINFGDENNVFVHHSSIGRFGGVLQRLTSFITNVHTHTHTHIYIYIYIRV